MFYKMMNELVRNQCDVTNHQVNVQFLLQLQPKWQRFVTLVKQSQKLKTVSYHKIYDILKQHQNEVNEIRAERLLAHTANPLALVTQQQPVYHPQNHPNQYTQNSLTNITSCYRKQRINRGTMYDNQRTVNVAGARENVARECQKPKRAKDAAYHKEKMLLCKQLEAEIQLSAEQVDWRDDTNDEPEDQELEAHYLYMTQIQEVILDAAENSGPIFDAEPLQKVQNDDDNYNVFANDKEFPVQPESINDTYLDEQERDLLAFLIEKLKCEIDESKDRNKLLESSNKTLVDKLNGEIEDFKNKNKGLESSNNHFKEVNTELAKNNHLIKRNKTFDVQKKDLKSSKKAN
ncbi:hypothetical protein Tco_1095282 [Tanacetum coccineum]